MRWLLLLVALGACQAPAEVAPPCPTVFGLTVAGEFFTVTNCTDTVWVR